MNPTGLLIRGRHSVTQVQRALKYPLANCTSGPALPAAKFFCQVLESHFAHLVLVSMAIPESQLGSPLATCATWKLSHRQVLRKIPREGQHWQDPRTIRLGPQKKTHLPPERSTAEPGHSQPCPRECRKFVSTMRISIVNCQAPELHDVDSQSNGPKERIRQAARPHAMRWKALPECKGCNARTVVMYP